MNNAHNFDRRDLLTARTLRDENQVFSGTGGVSAGNRTLGFRPAFKDTASGIAKKSAESIRTMLLVATGYT